MAPLRQLPALPEIGYPESYYAQRVKQADKAGDAHAHEAFKVGQYITLGLDPHATWESKAKYFRHALRRHCVPPRTADALVSMFYQRLADLVRRYAGEESLRLASIQDEVFEARLHNGETRDQIASDGVPFFLRLMGADDDCPGYINEEDWAQLRVLRDQWV